jgi:hypothetical protein
MSLFAGFLAMPNDHHKTRVFRTGILRTGTHAASPFLIEIKPGKYLLSKESLAETHNAAN